MKLPNVRKQERKQIEQKHFLEDQKLSRTKLKIIVFNVINAVLLAGLIFMLRQLPRNAEKVKELHSQSIASQEESDIGVLEAEIDKSQGSIDRISNLFATDIQFLDFISQIDKLEETGVVRDFNLPVTTPVLDSTKNPGLPVSMTFTGSKEEINQAFVTISQMPFILKPVNISMDVGADGIIIVRYGGFLYTNEKFSKN